MTKALAVMMLVALCGSAVHAQPPAVDQTDPAAVAKAYIEACHKADIDGALALLVPEPDLQTFVRMMATGMKGEQEREMGVGGLRGFLQELALIPVGLADAPGEARVEGEGEVTVSVAAAPTPAQKLVLEKSADGLWRVDLRKSIVATTGREQSALMMQAAAMGQGGQGPQGGGNEDWRAQEKIRQASQVVLEYSREHGDKLPDAEAWTDDVVKWALDASALRRPGLKEGECGYALNMMLAGQPVPNWPEAESTVVLFEVDDPAPNLVGDPDADRAEKLLSGRAPWVAMASGQVTQGKPGESVANWAESRQDEEKCQTHLTLIGRALRQYAREHDGKLPPAESWCDDIGPLIDPNQAGPDIWTCPAVPDVPYAYAINEALAGVDVRTLSNHQSRILLVHGKRGVRNEAVEVGVAAPADAPHRATWNGGGGEAPNTDIYCTLAGNVGMTVAGMAYPSAGPESATTE